MDSLGILFLARCAHVAHFTQSHLITFFFWTDVLHLVTCLCMKMEAIDLGICSILIFLEKGLGILSSPHLVYDFSIKMFFVLYSIN